MQTRNIGKEVGYVYNHEADEYVQIADYWQLITVIQELVDRVSELENKITQEQ